MSNISVDKNNNQALLQIQPFYENRHEFAEIAKAEGLAYEVIELSMPPALNESGLFARALEWYKASQRVESYHGVFVDINPASGDKNISTISRKLMKASCDTAVELGAKNIVFHGSCFPFLRGGYLDNWAKVFGDFCLELVDDYDLNIFIENSFDLDTMPLKKLMTNVDSNRIGVCLDYGHANFSRDPMEKWFDDLGEHIGYLHISDNNGLFDDHLPLLSGTVNWNLASDLWKKLNKKVPITLEIKTVEEIKKAIDYFKKNQLFGL